MSTDYGEKERQFLETLKADTGRTLDEWMAAIAAEGLAHRNDIIDWLRRKGFMFSKASWLERIHNNGGRPIYEGAGSPRPRTRRRSPAPPRPPTMDTPHEGASAAQPASEQPAASPAAPAVGGQPDPAALEALLARAKAFRPLAVYLLAEIRKAVPAVVVTPQDGYVTFRIDAAAFALLVLGPKELRLGLAVRSGSGEAPLETAKFALRGAPPMSHMAGLTDARQVTPALMAAVARAAAGG